MPGQRNRGVRSANFVPRPAQPFQPGNHAATTHGARSPRLIADAVERLIEEIVETVPALANQRYARAVRAWATSEVRLDRVRDYTDAMQIEKLTGDRGTGRYHLELERIADRLRRELALTLASHAAISRSDVGKVADSEHARSAVGKLYADLQSVVADGRVGEVVAAAAKREELERKAEEAGL